MNSKLGYIKKGDRKKILLLCDDIRMHSGVATIGRELVIRTSHHFNWVNLGAAVKHLEVNKIFDLSKEVNKENEIEDSDVKVIPSVGYGDAETLRKLIKYEKPDAILIFTDPRYWTWLFEIEREIRSKIPIFWLNIWDEYPAPLYNKPYYRSVDLLLAISQQTRNINEIVLGEDIGDTVVKYLPHGVNEKYFYPISKDHEGYEEFLSFKKSLFGGKEHNFVVFFNSRNIQRKHPADLMLAFKLFCDNIGPEVAKKCCLIMHTQPIDNMGTNLHEVRESLCSNDYVNIYFSDRLLSTSQMNILYNVSDVTVLPSSNEGWGLSLTESMMTGKMIIANVTGGIQDQLRFEDDKGNWAQLTPDFPSNHKGTYKTCGKWAVPVFPNNLSLAGSIPTPYIYDARCSIESIAEAIEVVYNLTPEERNERGLAGREWVTSEESGMSSKVMSERFITHIDEAFLAFKPRPSYEVIKVKKLKRDTIQHKIIGY